MKKSAVIIGGGLGGLFTGAILAKEGLQVTVLEKNSTIGGGLQSFTRFGEVFDTGMHIIGGMREGGSMQRICRYLGIWEDVKIKDVDGITDSVYFEEDGREYRIAAGKKEYVEVLSESFPDQRDNLHNYLEAMYRLADEVDLFYLRPSGGPYKLHSEDFLLPANDFIAKYISDERLRSVVAYMNPLYGGRGNMTPAYMHALISVLYIEGPSRFAGGSCLFAETLGDAIRRSGGSVVAGDGVRTIETEGRFIKGVRTEKGREYTADYYISDIHPCTLIKLLDDPTALPKSYRERLDSVPNTYSAFSVYIKLKKNSFRYFNHSAYYMTTYRDIWNFGDGSRKWPLGFLYMTPPGPDQGEWASKILITAPMIWDEVRRWEDTTVGHRGEEYTVWKKQCTERLLECMEKIHPGFRSCIDEINTASPLTIRDFYGVKEGSMCGFSKDCHNMILSQVPVVTKIPNLLLTGQNCNLHGFCGVTLTAINTAEAILGENYVLNRIADDRFEDIRPYRDSEIPEAMERIVSSDAFPELAGYVFPEKTAEESASLMRSFTNVRDFQINVMHTAIRRIVSNSMTDFSYDGVENVRKEGSHLFVSNHRDIMLDASLLQILLVENGFDTTEITFGSNLMKGDTVIDIGKSNKMFKVLRPGGSIAEFYKASRHLSDYIRAAIVTRGQSVWIANRNGRTKDGVDRTDPGIVKMFGMSCEKDRVKAISALNILPIAISYEWEPCDILKTLELYARSKGPYTKQEGEDLNSILTGIRQWKGRVHMSLCRPIIESELSPMMQLTANEFYRRTAALIDARICEAYHLFPNNYIAHDILSGSDEFAAEYTLEQKETFIRHMEQLNGYSGDNDAEELRKIFLGIYANPVDSRKKFEQSI